LAWNLAVPFCKRIKIDNNFHDGASPSSIPGFPAGATGSRIPALGGDSGGNVPLATFAQGDAAALAGNGVTGAAARRVLAHFQDGGLTLKQRKK
jgi:hypothetical protein